MTAVQVVAVAGWGRMERLSKRRKKRKRLIEIEKKNQVLTMLLAEDTVSAINGVVV